MEHLEQLVEHMGSKKSLCIVFLIISDQYQGGCRGGTGSRITRKENSLSQFHDENKYLSRFTKKNSCKQYYDMYKVLTNIP